MNEILRRGMLIQNKRTGTIYAVQIVESQWTTLYGEKERCVNTALLKKGIANGSWIVIQK